MRQAFQIWALEKKLEVIQERKKEVIFTKVSKTNMKDKVRQVRRMGFDQPT